MPQTYGTFGAPVKIDDNEDGVYEVTQLDARSNLSNLSYNDGNRSININVGAVKVVGFMTESTLDTGIDIFIYGLFLGSFYGDIKDGIHVKVNIVAESGNNRVFFENRDTVLTVDLRTMAGRPINDKVTLFSL